MIPKSADKRPLISVLLPAYNAEKYIRESVESILAQTYPHFELLVIDDGSDDKTAEIVASIKDARLKLIRNPQNLGLIKTLNRAVSLAQGAYIARMDADDISLPERLEKQLNLLQANSELILCGTSVYVFSDKKTVQTTAPTTHNAILWKMLYQTPFVHPSIMLNTKKTGTHFYYDQNYPHCEDYELFVRLAKVGKMANLPEPLYRYRRHPESVSIKFSATQAAKTRQVIKNYWQYFGVTLTDEDYQNVLSVFYKQFSDNRQFIKKAETILLQLLAGNRKESIISENYLVSQISSLWYHLCYNSGQQTWDEWAMYHKSPLPKKGVTWVDMAKIILKKSLRRRS